MSSSTATGSGFCVSASQIVTNAHVVGRDRRVSVLSRSRDRATARVVRTDTRRDLALLKAPGVCRQWLTLAEPSEERIGTDLIVVGAPKGLSWSVARGIVSAVRMPRGFTEIQTDAPINPGNSGGPLVSADSGKVLGVVTSAYKSQWEGLGFAVGADEIGRAFPGLMLRWAPLRQHVSPTLAAR